MTSKHNDNSDRPQGRSLPRLGGPLTKASKLISSRHLAYVVYMCDLARRNGVEVSIATDDDGCYTDRLQIDLRDVDERFLSLYVVVPPPPDDWPVYE